MNYEIMIIESNKRRNSYYKDHPNSYNFYDQQKRDIYKN